MLGQDFKRHGNIRFGMESSPKCGVWYAGTHPSNPVRGSRPFGQLGSQGMFGDVSGIFCCHNQRRVCPWHLGGQRPGKLHHLLQCTGQLPAQRLLQPRVYDVVSRLRDPGLSTDRSVHPVLWKQGSILQKISQLAFFFPHTFKLKKKKCFVQFF